MAARIVIFAKAPVPGQAKTRLIPTLGAEGAAALAQRMLLHTFEQAASAKGARTELCLAPAPDDPDWRGRLPTRAERLTPQGDGNLGARLARAAERVIAEGDPVIFIGTDCPELDTAALETARLALESHDAVIHPAHDGGYALLGLKRFDPSIFSGIAWSTDEVASATIARIAALGWSLHVGETLRDIDEPADLVHLSRHSRESGSPAFLPPTALEEEQRNSRFRRHDGEGSGA